MDNSFITERIKALDPNYIEFVSSFSTEAANTFGGSVGLQDTNLAVFKNGIYLYLLVLITEEEFIKFTTEECGLSTEDSSQIVQAIISSLPAKYKTLHTETFAIFNPNQTSADVTLDDDILKMQQTLDSMESNTNTRSNPEIIHTSNQESILGDKKQSNQPPEPTWESKT